jgi:hypothetical protein
LAGGNYGSNNDKPRLYTRTTDGHSDAWGSWYELLTTYNYSSYANFGSTALTAGTGTFGGNVSVDGALTLTGGNATMTFSNTDQISHLQLNTPDGGTMKGGISIGGGSSSTQGQAHFITMRGDGYMPGGDSGWGMANYDTAIWTQNSVNGALWFGTNEEPAIKIDTSQNTTVYGNVYPSADNSVDLGSSSKRWANLYVADMQMNNEGTGGNEVDGTEGSWTIQEGEDDLYVINRKTGKKFKIKLEEI